MATTPHLDLETGLWICKDGHPEPFLPAKPANSPPYELIVTTEPDPETEDGHTHYLIGGDPDVVDQIIQHYHDKHGLDVPAGYKEAAAEHAAAAAAAKPPATT